MDEKKDKDNGKKLFMVSNITGECSSFPIISGADQLDRYSQTEMLRRINSQAAVRKGDGAIEVEVKIPSVRLKYLLGEEEDTRNIVRTIRRSAHGTSSPAPISFNFPSLNAAPLLLLRIGAWQAVPTSEGDLVAKFDYRSKTLAWEMFDDDGISKQKIEIDWLNIIGIEAIIQDNRQGILQLELQNPPRFYKLDGVDSSSQKQPRWTNESDFTGGRASLSRRHFAVLPPGAIDAHYKRLMKNKHLLEVSKRPFPTTKSSHFPRPKEGTILY